MIPEPPTRQKVERLIWDLVQLQALYRNLHERIQYTGLNN